VAGISKLIIRAFYVERCSHRDAVTPSYRQPDLDEAARAADATREVMERWLPDSEISLGHKEATL